MIDHGASMTDPASQRRNAARRKMFEPVILCFGGAEVRAHFLDLSCSGALAHCEAPPLAGQYISVKGLGALGLETSGRVMWSKGKRFGLRFSQPLSQADLDALIDST